MDNINKARKGLEGVALSYSEADGLHAELPYVRVELGSFAGKWASPMPKVSGYV